MHIAILKLFCFQLFNFSYKSNMLILRHSHVTAVFVNNDVQRRRRDIDEKFASVERMYCQQVPCRIFGRRMDETQHQQVAFPSSENLVLLTDVNQLEQCLIDTWSSLSQDIIDDAIDQWRVQLRACVKAKGRHFECLLQQTGSFQSHPKLSEEDTVPSRTHRIVSKIK